MLSNPVERPITAPALSFNTRGTCVRRGSAAGVANAAVRMAVDTFSHVAPASHACTNHQNPRRIAVSRASYNGYYLSFPS